jgi:tRNA(Ile)-lysidine synthase
MPEHALLDHTTLDAQLTGLLDASHWYVGFSGGLDSTALLHLLQRWRRDNPSAPPLTAIHINHALQAAADDWQVHCALVCKKLQVAFISRTVDAPGAGGSEAAARELRYGVFQQQLQPGSVLFLGHHLDDQVETFFLRLMRGAGVQGLAAIPARRQLGEGILCRPLLNITRSQLERYAGEHGLDCVQDPSNSDTAMDRNFLRAELLPLLATRWPGYRQTVTRAIGHMAGAVMALQEALPTPETVHSVMGDPGVALDDLILAPVEVSAVKLRGWLQAVGCPAPDQAPLDEFLRQLRVAAADANPRLVCSAFILQRYRDAVYLLPEIADPHPLAPVTLAAGELMEVPGVGLLGLEGGVGQGLSLAPGEQLEVAWRRGGERCKPVGRGGSNSLKKLLQEWAVPPWWRDRVPLLSLEGELLAVGDLWLCDSSRWRDSAQPDESRWILNWNRATNTRGD